MDQREVYRLCCLLYRRIQTVFAGGLAYGVDWPTLRACYPQTAALYQAALIENEKRAYRA
jgi:hypothetical protein